MYARFFTHGFGMNVWAKNKRLTATLLVIWFLTTLLVGVAPDFMRWSFFGWDFTYWFGAQGALFIYVLLVWLYAHKMQKYEKKKPKHPDL